MRRFLQPAMMRGPRVQRVAIVLFLGLLAVLAVSFIHGFSALRL